MRLNGAFYVHSVPNFAFFHNFVDITIIFLVT